MGLKEKILKTFQYTRDYEFDAKLENHPIGNQNIYRLHYINYHRIGESYEIAPDNIGMIDFVYQTFMLPHRMHRNDAFKVLSYLTDYIEEQLNLPPCSQKSVSVLNQVLDLERLGFRKINIKSSINNSDIIDLFTVTGRLLLFKQSANYSRYFEWYTEGVTLEEIKDIYSKCEMDFYDIIFSDKKDDVECTRALKK